MSRIYKAELFKLFHRSETFIIVFLLILSFALPIGFKLAPSSYALEYAFGDGRLPTDAYMVLGYAFWGTLGIFVLLYSILSVALLSRELENRYFFLYFPRVTDRGKIYIAKYLILLCFMVIWYFVYTILLNPIGHTMMCEFRPDMAVKLASDDSHSYWICMWILNLAELVLYISIATAFGTKLKPVATIAIVMAIYYFCMFFYDFPLVKYIIPEFYKQTAMKCEDLSRIETVYTNTVIYVVMVLVYSTCLFLIGKKMIEKKNA